MNQAILDMLGKYEIKKAGDAENALKEIIQEVALLGLHRSNFFEKAAFYGGTALRILYGLPRFSEDMDFTLFQPTPDFSLTPYFSALEKELAAYGFQCEVERVDKKMKSVVESAFIKSNSKINFLNISPLKQFESQIQPNAKLQVKFEVDIDPITNFEYETKYLLAPISFPIISLKKEDLFAGKVHALLFRRWKNRIKGRDFYDYVWYLKTKTPLRLPYLHEKAFQSGHIDKNDLTNLVQLKEKLIERFQSVDIDKAKEDVFPFIKDPTELDSWSADFFIQITDQLTLAK